MNSVKNISFAWHNKPQEADWMLHKDQIASKHVPLEWKRLGERYFQVNPWYLDYVSCTLAKRMGYDSIQYPFVEGKFRLVEIVSCDAACYSIPRFSLTGACVDNVLSVDGTRCKCSETQDVLQCM